jgi:integrase/recombinase XerD
MNVTVSNVLVKSRETTKGFPIKLRITCNRKSDYLGLNIYSSDEDFEKVKQSKRLNPELKKLKQELIQIEQKANRILSEMTEYSFKEFKKLYFGIVPDNKDSLEYCFNSYIKELKESKKLKTATIYESTINSIHAFKSDLSIKDINVKFLESYKKNLLQQDKSMTTVSIYFRCLRSIINKNRDLLEAYPFQSFKVPSPENNKRAINEKNLKSLLSYESDNPNDKIYLDLYKFSYYCGGLNIKDALLLKPENINDGFLTYKRAKTNKPVHIFLLPEALKIIEKYRSKSETYIFPLLKNEKPEYLIHRVHAIVKRVNKRLEKACEALEMPKITTYSARHSFATTLMNKGVSIAFISQSLGHTSISTTQNYLGSFTNDQIKEGMNMLLK